MPKIIFLLLLSISFLQANFWENINNNNLYNDITLAKELTSTQNNELAEDDNTSALRDAQIKNKILFFNQLTNTIKTKPYLNNNS